MTPHFCIKKFGHDPCHPTQVEADTVFHRRHIQFFGRGVYMHSLRAIVNSLFVFLVFQRLCRGQKHCASMAASRRTPVSNKELRLRQEVYYFLGDTRGFFM